MSESRRGLRSQRPSIQVRAMELQARIRPLRCQPVDAVVDHIETRFEQMPIMEEPIAAKWGLVVLAIIAGCLFVPGSQAQTGYPAKPVRIIVPSSPGGGTDTVTRLLAQHLSEKLGQQFYIENRPGAGSMTGIEAGARAAPDGYTLLVAASTMTSLHVVRKKMRFDAVKDFEPITLLVSMPNVIVVHPSLSVATFTELIALAKKQPGQLSFATPGFGSTAHLAMEQLKSSAGIDMLQVPYNGVAPALTDVIAGRVPVMLVNAASAKSHLDAGSVRALAVSSLKRASALPNLPTVAESGIPNYEAIQWFGLLAPAGTPKEIVAQLHAETIAALKTERIVRWMATEGADAGGNSPEEFSKMIASEVAKWSAVARAANIKPQ
ncbi:MAG: tripartite tricarboxylate transporter substrate binding protein [Rhizobiales bacterium]|nr:tripartite tricarboxylate transporter substrate binding protein [Hyphomicrobiales bacterium]